MKYKWSDKPPKGVPGVGAEKSNVWPKPDKASLKYTTINHLVLAIGKIKTNGRWEVWIYEPIVRFKNGMSKIIHQWQAKSRYVKDHRIGYSNRKNAYRSITQHLRSF